MGSRLLLEGKSADRFSTAGIAGTDFCVFLCLNTVSALIALFFSPQLWLCNKGALSGCLWRGWRAMVGGGCSVGTGLSSSSMERAATHGLSFNLARTVTPGS